MGPIPRAKLIEIEDDFDAVNLLYREKGWGDGLPVVPPTEERVNEMLRQAGRAADEVIGFIPPGFGKATVELIAINAVLAGCEPDYLPVVIAAVAAACAPEFNLQGIQSTTNPATVWLIVHGPIAAKLKINGGVNCLGQGAWANATIGRALHLSLQNIGAAFPGTMDRATQGQPGKYTFCCAENNRRNPWDSLHIERGYPQGSSAVTVVGASGTLNMLSHEKDAVELLRVFADTICYPTSNDYWCGGEPWIVLGPEHAEIFANAGLTKDDLRRELWRHSKMTASRRAPKDYARTQNARTGELGDITPQTLLPISPAACDIGIIVAGGPGTHSVYVPTFGNTRSVTHEVTSA